MNSSSQALRAAKTEETVSHHQNNRCFRWWGPRHCEATCVLRNLLFQQQRGTESQRQGTNNQLLKPEAKDSATHYESPCSSSSLFRLLLGLERFQASSSSSSSNVALNPQTNHQRQGVQEVHLDFHTVRSMLLYVRRDHKAYQGRGAQDGHLDFHTAPKLCLQARSGFLYVHRKHKALKREPFIALAFQQSEPLQAGNS